MARLSEPQKVEIVRLLGAGATPPQVAARMRENHGITVDRFQIRAYDASGPRFEGGAHLSDLFWEQREAYQNELASIPIVHAAYRLGQIQQLHERAKAKGDIRNSMALLKMAAKEAKLFHVWSTNLGDLSLRHEQRPQIAQRAELAEIFDRVMMRRARH
ncbi:MAG: DUF2280 domain-containing protein [Sphingomonadales bacterium]|nr:DUF2280 domain-containing protein [Sphingomonadales bacterium]MBK6490443.1 DUF2280 domain-containing protein [Sphingomonadales bacterium]MBK6719599.1 DUF2280 domain-containing protein [Sphingomonadales bacterium]MBK9589426.1 DUF2280 domain-containing protein [Sphingomonadales bacterium]MBK9999768.1 DUF2280 domain-containing protein [Sphingomonadales bacterium]